MGNEKCIYCKKEKVQGITYIPYGFVCSDCDDKYWNEREVEWFTKPIKFQTEEFRKLKEEVTKKFSGLRLVSLDDKKEILRNGFFISIDFYERSLEALNKVDQFIMLWISFNALYSTRFYYDKNRQRKGGEPEKNEFDNFLKKHFNNQEECKRIVELYNFRELYELYDDKVYLESSNEGIKKIWKPYKGSNAWKFYNEKDYVNALKELINRIYELRCKVMHGQLITNSPSAMGRLYHSISVMASFLFSALKKVWDEIQ